MSLTTIIGRWRQVNWMLFFLNAALLFIALDVVLHHLISERVGDFFGIVGYVSLLVGWLHVQERDQKARWQARLNKESTKEA